jgi:hypothetical protein
MGFFLNNLKHATLIISFPPVNEEDVCLWSRGISGTCQFDNFAEILLEELIGESRLQQIFTMDFEPNLSEEIKTSALMTYLAFLQ